MKRTAYILLVFLILTCSTALADIQKAYDFLEGRWVLSEETKKEYHIVGSAVNQWPTFRFTTADKGLSMFCEWAYLGSQQVEYTLGRDSVEVYDVNLDLMWYEGKTMTFDIVGTELQVDTITGTLKYVKEGGQETEWIPAWTYYELFRECPVCGEKTVSVFSEHPHRARIDYCSRCKTAIYPEGEEFILTGYDDEIIVDGRTYTHFSAINYGGELISDCKTCFPENFDLPYAKAMLERCLLAYERGSMPTGFLKGTNDFWISGTGSTALTRDELLSIVKLKRSITATNAVMDVMLYGENALPDTMISFETTADGAPLLQICFKGSREVIDWLIDTITYPNKWEDEIHNGFGDLISTFMDEWLFKKRPLKGMEYSPSAYVYDTEGKQQDTFYTKTGVQRSFSYFWLPDSADSLNDPDRIDVADMTLEDMIQAVNRVPGGHIVITGHSMGGALAQILTYKLITEMEVSPEKILTYTFATPIPFTYRSIQDKRLRKLNVYNCINLNDPVTKVGTTYSKNALVRLSETVINYCKNRSGGRTVLAGANLGVNVILVNQEIGKEYSELKQHFSNTYQELLDDSDTVYLEFFNDYLFDGDVFDEKEQEMLQSAMEDLSALADLYGLVRFGSLIKLIVP